jgi:NADPH:quinone reductase-like Zn-dependent oxidoreductase
MRAFVVTKYKEPLQEADVPEPVVGEHDVLVRVDAAGLNPLDEGIRAGGFKQILQYRLPLVLGNDLAGTVIRVGAKVRGFKPGDEVYARPDKDRIGTFAERIAVAEADLALKPASISMEEAGSLPLVALTASRCGPLPRAALAGKASSPSPADSPSTIHLTPHSEGRTTS